MAVEWGARPPRKLCKASIRILCLEAGQEVACCVLGPTVGVSTHWTGKRSVPCFGKRECQFCDTPKTWKGFTPVEVHAWSHQGKAQGFYPWVLMVTEEIGEESLTWERGQILMVGRPGKKSNGPLRALTRVGEWQGLMPQSFDVRPYVLRCSGFSAGDYGKLKLSTGTDSR